MKIQFESFAIVKMGKNISLIKSGKIIDSTLPTIDAALKIIEKQLGYPIVSAVLKEKTGIL